LGNFLIKLFLNGIVSVPLLMWVAEATLGSAIIVSIALCVVAYFLGDQVILRASNNVIATIADAVLVVVFLSLASYFLNWHINSIQMITIALVLGVVEAFFHRYLQNEAAA
jgi:membrane protein HdeD